MSPDSSRRASAFSSITSPRAVLTMKASGRSRLQTARRQQMKRRRRVGAIDRHNIHAGEHLVETLPIGRVRVSSSIFGATLAAIVIVHLQAEGARRGAPPPGRCGPCR